MGQSTRAPCVVKQSSSSRAPSVKITTGASLMPAQIPHGACPRTGRWFAVAGCSLCCLASRCLSRPKKRCKLDDGSINTAPCVVKQSSSSRAPSVKITTGASLMPAQIPHGRMSSNRSMVCSSRVQSLLSGLEVPLQAKCFSKGICQLRQNAPMLATRPNV